MKHKFIVLIFFCLLTSFTAFAQSQCIGNCQIGKGSYQWSNGDFYDGYWLNGKRHGMGTMKWKTGDVYTGFWKEDNMAGKGTMVWSDGTKYEGNWLDGKKNGLGKLFINGTVKSDGSWVNDVFMAQNSVPNLPATDKKMEVKPSTSKVVKKVEYKGLSIIGNEVFIEHISKAIDLLSLHASEELTMVKQYVIAIKQHDKSGMRAWTKTIELADVTTFHSLEWCASVLVHEAYHSKLYHDYEQKNPNSNIPYEVYGGVEAEQKCNLIQAEVGKKIGLNKDDIDYLLKADGKHGDVDGDGDIDEDDYKLRDWE